jgi:hypothetical protein
LKILQIDEEYGFNSWYAVISDERWEELKIEWKTIKGLCCLVPIRFLVPEAVNLPLLPQDIKYSNSEYLKENNIEVLGAHVHQSDDSWLEGVNYDIPDQEEFEFKGKTYNDKEVHDIFNKYRDEEHKLWDQRVVLDDLNERFYLPCKNQMEVTDIFVWPEDVNLPQGFVRKEDGQIVKES